MKENMTEIICVIDKSSSMTPRTKEVIEGFNKFLKDQQALPGEAKLTLTLFDTEYKVLHNGVDIKIVPELDEKTYAPMGFTALLDAVGRTIDEVGVRLSKISDADRPGKVIFLIITDGEENSSREYALDTVKQQIIHQQDNYKWEFVFLGANQDALDAANRFGIPLSNAANVSNTSDGVVTAYAAVSDTVSTYRNTGKVDMDDKGKFVPDGSTTTSGGQ